MSGFEVVGVVLGVLPLAVKAIKTYCTILSSVRSAQSDLNWLRQDLETEHIRLQNTCEILLNELAPLSKVDGLIRDPFGPDWIKYNDRLRLRLWSSWGIFQTQVELISNAAVELEKKLCVDRNGVIRLNSYKKVLEELKQNTDFTLRKRDYETLLQKIKSSNTIIHDLARQEIILESSRKHRSQARLVKLLRVLSRSIFEAMHSAVTCKCIERHSMGIGLANRSAFLVPDDEENEVAKSFLFEVVFDTSGSPREWSRAQLQVDDPPSSCTAKTSTQPVVNAPKAEKKPKKLGWDLSSRLPSNQHKTITPSAIGMLAQSSGGISASFVASTSGPRSPSKISNICQMFHEERKPLPASDCYGYISSAGKRSFKLHPPFERPSKFSQTYTLREVLSGFDDIQWKNRHPFGYEERLHLALTLASSVLQIYNTPWLTRVVTLDDIVFFWGESNETPSQKSHPPYRPFVTRLLPWTSDESPAGSKKIPQMINMTVLSLGALLVQIILGGVEDSLKITGTVDYQHVLAQHANVRQLEAKVLENGGPNYAKVVKWCFDNAIGLAGFQNEKFCQEFHEVVIATLEQDAALLEEQQTDYFDDA